MPVVLECPDILPEAALPPLGPVIAALDAGRPEDAGGLPVIDPEELCEVTLIRRLDELPLYELLADLRRPAREIPAYPGSVYNNFSITRFGTEAHYIPPLVSFGLKLSSSKPIKSRVSSPSSPGARLACASGLGRNGVDDTRTAAAEAGLGRAPALAPGSDCTPIVPGGEGTDVCCGLEIA
jgi:hypothetical protein